VKLCFLCGELLTLTHKKAKTVGHRAHGTMGGNI
jgi:hypothetical protein